MNERLGPGLITRQPLRVTAGSAVTLIREDFPPFIFLFSCCKKSGFCHSQAMVWQFNAITEDLNHSIFLFCHPSHTALVFMVTRRLLLLQAF